MTVANLPTSTSSAAAARQDAVKEPGVVIGTLTGFDADGAALVQFGGRAATAALTVAELRDEHIGALVVLQFEGSNHDSPIVMGVVRAPRAEAGRADGAALAALTDSPLRATVDDEEIMLLAHRRITLMCGAASITLDAQGNIEIRGKHILSRASGQNRIKGGSVSLN